MLENQPSRLLSLDVYRGLTIAFMILVTDPGTYSYRYTQLGHADWAGPTATDMVFPSFLVITGISLVLSFAARLGRGATPGLLAQHVVRRSLLLVGLGVLVNCISDLGVRTLRFPGILQRIGVCYLLAGLLCLALVRPGVSLRQRLGALGGAALAVLLLYGALLRFYPTPGFGPGRLDSLGSLPAVVDRAVLTVPHMWAYGTTPGYGVTFDPEGLLSTLGALANVLFGCVAGLLLQAGRRRAAQCGWIAGLGTALWWLGLALNPGMPLIKKIWTSSFALWSSGLALLVFAALFYLIDLRPWRRGWGFALVFGTNAIFAFVLSQILTNVLSRVRVGYQGQSTELYTMLYERFLAIAAAPRLSSLLYAVVLVAVNAALVYPLYRRRIFLRL